MGGYLLVGLMGTLGMATDEELVGLVMSLWEELHKNKWKESVGCQACF